MAHGGRDETWSHCFSGGSGELDPVRGPSGRTARAEVRLLKTIVAKGCEGAPSMLPSGEQQVPSALPHANLLAGRRHHLDGFRFQPGCGYR